MVNYIAEYPDEGISMRKISGTKTSNVMSPQMSIVEYIRAIGLKKGDTVLVSWSKKQQKIVIQHFKGFNKDIDKLIEK